MPLLDALLAPARVDEPLPLDLGERPTHSRSSPRTRPAAQRVDEGAPPAELRRRLVLSGRKHATVCLLSECESA